MSTIPNNGVARLHRTTLGLAVCVGLLAGATEASAQTPIPADAKPTCTVTAPVFASWFKAGVVAANAEVNPANSVTFPNSPNCSFYQWSEQMFLWLNSPTPPTYGGGGGRIFDSKAFFDVSPPDQNGDRTLVPHTNGLLRPFNLRAAQFGLHGLPVVFDKRGHMLEVLHGPTAPNGHSLLRNKAGKMVEIAEARAVAGRKPTFLDAAGKAISFRIGSNFAPELELKRAAEAAAPKDRMDPRSMHHANALLLKRIDKAKLVRRITTSAGKIIFLDQNGNTIEVEQGQAGGNGVLLAQNGSLVYYASVVNDVYAYLLTGTKDGGITPPPTQFPTTQAALDKIVAFAQAHGVTFPDAEALAIEVKSAWVETTGLDASKYVTVKATIPTYDTSSSAQWTPNGTKDATLAMVGMHVVGSAKGHPEMIWATFEHVDNTPNAAYSYVNTSSQTISVPQHTAGTWLFSHSNSAGPFNTERMFFDSPNIVAVGGQTIGASDTIRWKAWGAASDVAPNPLVSSAGSNTEIIAINNSVLGQLAGGDLRKNYIMTGATWTIGGAAPSGGNEVGTSSMANTTMETYQQGDNNKKAGGSNCFSCHGSNTFAVSHFFDDLKPLF